MDHRFFPFGGPSRQQHWISFQGSAAATATSASLFLLSFCATFFLPASPGRALTTRQFVSPWWWWGANELHRVTLACCHQSQTDSPVRCNITLCLRQKWLVLILFPSYSILYLLINVTTNMLRAIFSLSFLFQVHGCRHHRDGGRDVRCLLRGRLHCQSPGSRLLDPLWSQLSW